MGASGAAAAAKVELHELPDGSIGVSGVQQVPIRDQRHLLQLLEQGNHQRSTAAHK
jgi:hypothetical protein